MTIKELEKYCVNESIKCIGKAKETSGEECATFKGKALAFMWIAGKIQNEVENDRESVE